MSDSVVHRFNPGDCVWLGDVACVVVSSFCRCKTDPMYRVLISNDTMITTLEVIEGAVQQRITTHKPTTYIPTF